MQRSLIPQIKDRLKIGGMVVFEEYAIGQLKNRCDAPGSKNPEYSVKHNELPYYLYSELLNIFRDFYILYYREGEREDNRSVVSMIAKKIR
ncbi:MAG: hypothetical protein ACE5KZ_16000 [Candidatus Scalinduaceae bacterium]